MNDDQYERHVHDTGYHMGFHDGYKAVLPILTDLIEEMRSQWEVFEDTDGHRTIRKKPEGWWGTAADRAEARLREAVGDE